MSVTLPLTYPARKPGLALCVERVRLSASSQAMPESRVDIEINAGARIEADPNLPAFRGIYRAYAGLCSVFFRIAADL